MDRATTYWQKNSKLISILLIIWAFFSFGSSILFVDQLDHFKLFGYPLGFWFAQQGAIYIYIVLIVVYTIKMNQFDDAYNASPDPSLDSQNVDQNS